MSDIDVAALRAAAEGATLPMTCGGHRSMRSVIRCEECTTRADAMDDLSDATSPAVVLELLDRLAAAEGALRWITSDAPHDGSDDAEDAMHDRAMAALALVVGGNLQGPQIKTEETQ